LTDIYVDGDACPVREEIYRVATRLGVKVFVVSNGSRPIRPPGMSNVSMVLVGDTADAADDWIVARIGAADVCVTSDIPLASRASKKERGSAGAVVNRGRTDAAFRISPARQLAAPRSIQPSRSAELRAPHVLLLSSG
jgi:uncharacterized protein